MSKNEDRRNKPLDEAARKLSRNYEIEQRSKKTTQTQTQNTHTHTHTDTDTRTHMVDISGIARGIRYKTRSVTDTDTDTQRRCPDANAEIWNCGGEGQSH